MADYASFVSEPFLLEEDRKSLYNAIDQGIDFCSDYAVLCDPLEEFEYGIVSGKISAGCSECTLYFLCSCIEFASVSRQVSFVLMMENGDVYHIIKPKDGPVSYTKLL